MPDLMDNVGFHLILKASNVFYLSAGDPTGYYYYSIFQRLFKFIPDIVLKKP